MKKICLYCKKEFNARRKTVKFCCYSCAGKNKIIDLKCKKFGKLSVVNKLPVMRKGKTFFLCKCDCGVTKEFESWNLRSGQTTSCGCQNKLEEGESACRHLFHLYKTNNAEKRGHVWKLLLEDFKIITKQNCFYCGQEPNNYHDRSKTRANGNYIYNGIDRKDNSKGYTKKNVVACCKTCNAMKSKLNKKQFLDQVKKINAYTMHTFINN